MVTRVPQVRARARVFHWKARPPTAFNAAGCGVLCHHGARGSFCQTSLWTAFYQGTQCSRLRRIRAELVASVNWM